MAVPELHYRDATLFAVLCVCGLCGAALSECILIFSNGWLAAAAVMPTPLGAPGDGNDILLMLGYLGYGLSWLVSAPTFLYFVYRTNQNARALGTWPLEHTPQTSILWYFVPIVSLWKPYAAIRELYLASAPNATTTDWRYTKPPLFLSIWWVTWLGCRIFDRVANQFDEKEQIVSDVSSVLGSALGVVAAFLCALVVHRLNKRYQERARAQGAR